MRLRVTYVPDDETWSVELDGRPAVRFQGTEAHARAGALAAELRNRIQIEMPWLDDEVAACPENR